MKAWSRGITAISFLVLLAVAIAAVQSPEESAPAATHAILLGVVMPSDARSGEQVSGRVVTNPKRYASIPGLRVVTAELRVSEERPGRAVLKGLVVDNGSGQKRAADQPITLKIPPEASAIPLTIAAADQPGEKTQVAVPIESKAVIAPTPKPPIHIVNTSKLQAAVPFTISPVITDTGIVLMHGPFGGDSSNTSVTTNGEESTVLGENPREAFVQPENARPGMNHMVLREGQYTESFEVFEPSVAINAARTTLKQNEDTTFDVKVSGLKLPKSAWKAGAPSETYDLGEVQKQAPDYTPPASGGDGQMLLIVKNDSPETVTMSGAHGETAAIPLSRSDLTSGSYDYKGNLHALKAGTFEIEARIVPFLAEVAGSTLEGGGGEGEKVHVEHVTYPNHKAKVTWPPDAVAPPEHVEGKTWPTQHEHMKELTWPKHKEKVTWPPKHFKTATWPIHEQDVTFPPDHVEGISFPNHKAGITWPPDAVAPPEHVEDKTWPRRDEHMKNATWPQHKYKVTWPPNHAKGVTWPVHEKGVTWPK